MRGSSYTCVGIGELLARYSSLFNSLFVVIHENSFLLALKGVGHGLTNTASVTVSGQVRRFDYVSEEYGIPTFLHSNLRPIDRDGATKMSRISRPPFCSKSAVAAGGLLDWCIPYSGPLRLCMSRPVWMRGSPYTCVGMRDLLARSTTPSHILFVIRHDKAVTIEVKGVGQGLTETTSFTVSGQFRIFDSVSEEYGIPPVLHPNLHPVDGGRHNKNPRTDFLAPEDTPSVRQQDPPPSHFRHFLP